MNRRGFLGALAGAIAAGADPERLLWTPGAKLISIPSPRVVPVSGVAIAREFFNLKTGDVITFYGDWKRYVIREMVGNPNALFSLHFEPYWSKDVAGGVQRSSE